MISHTDSHDELRSVARDLLARGPAVDWTLLAHAGWPGLEVPEVRGGAGVSFAEVAVVLEEVGRAASPCGYLGSALGAGVLSLLSSGTGRDELQSALATGTTRVAVALAADGAVDPPFRFDGHRIDGRADFVPDAEAAGVLLLPAVDPHGTPVVVALRAGAAGLAVCAQPVLDETRRLVSVTAQAAPVDPAAVWTFDGDPGAALNELVARARVAMACDSLGLAEAMLARTVDYAGVRRQFDRPIGSFQAVKHACADMLVQLSVGRRLTVAAIESITTGDAGAGTAAAMAKDYVCGRAVDIAGKAMQLHGGIGYTWESGIHVYLKRATVNRSWFGSPTGIRQQLARRYLQEPRHPHQPQGV